MRLSYKGGMRVGARRLARRELLLGFRVLDLLCVGRVADRVPRRRSTQKTNAGHVDLERSFCCLFWELPLLGAPEKPVCGDVEVIGDAADIPEREALCLKLLSYGASRESKFSS